MLKKLVVLAKDEGDMLDPMVLYVTHAKRDLEQFKRDWIAATEYAYNVCESEGNIATDYGVVAVIDCMTRMYGYEIETEDPITVGY